MTRYMILIILLASTLQAADYAILKPNSIKSSLSVRDRGLDTGIEWEALAGAEWDGIDIEAGYELENHIYGAVVKLDGRKIWKGLTWETSIRHYEAPDVSRQTAMAGKRRGEWAALAGVTARKFSQPESAFTFAIPLLWFGSFTWVTDFADVRVYSFDLEIKPDEGRVKPYVRCDGTIDKSDGVNARSWKIKGGVEIELNS